MATTTALLSTVWFNRMWYSLPLIVVISLVYAATRHELMAPILEHAKGHQPSVSEPANNSADEVPQAIEEVAAS